ncbi:MAG: hypothetical protein KC776_31590 [Myxococcales bacterium]|nr:hypothetical protein [Myxococcales bacterium]MCB9579441.1 hypothetical protein [Polyangiaceae bacterium]
MRWLVLMASAVACSPQTRAPVTADGSGARDDGGGPAIARSSASSEDAARVAERDASPATTTLVATECTGSDVDVLRALGSSGCLTAQPAPPLAPGVQLRLASRPRAKCHHCADLDVSIENPGAEALELFLPVRDGRFCIRSTAPREGGVPGAACTLVAGTRDGQEALARVRIAPRGRARFVGLQVDGSVLEERPFPDGTTGFFDRPLPPGPVTVQVSVPMAGAEGGHLLAPVTLDLP